MSDPFYVGYRELAAPDRRFLRIALPVTLWVLALLSAVFAYTMASVGEAVWDTGTERAWTGTFFVEPYPMLVPDDEPPLYVVEMGKTGAHDRLGSLDGRRVTLAGYRLERDGRRMIELVPEERGVVDVGPGREPPTRRSLGEAELVGEIVDGKCFMGAMKPGHGKGHKSCAVLCIRGGLPALFAVRDRSGEHRFVLLTVGGRSDAIAERYLNLVAEPVRVRGELFDVGGLIVLDAVSITP